MKFLSLFLSLGLSTVVLGQSWVEPIPSSTFSVLNAGEGIASKGGGVVFKVQSAADQCEFFEGATSLGFGQRVSAGNINSQAYVLRKPFFTAGTRNVHAVVTDSLPGGGSAVIATLPAISVDFSAPRPPVEIGECAEFQVTHTSAKLSCSVNHHGIDMQEWRFEVGSDPGQLSGVAPTKFLLSTNRPLAELTLQNQMPGSTIYWRFVVRTNDGEFASEIQSFALESNAGPLLTPYVFRLESGAPATITKYLLGYDPNSDDFKISSVSPGAHGIVELQNDGSAFEYTPGPDFPGSDEVEFELTDSFGTSTVGILKIASPPEFSRMIAGSYTAALQDSERYRASGMLNVSLTASGLCTGKFTIYDRPFSFTAAINEYATAEFEVPRYGRPPLRVHLSFFSHDGSPEGARMYCVVTDDQVNDEYRSPEAVGALVGGGADVEEAGQFALLLPVDPQSVASGEIPRGHGFAAARVSRAGRVKVAGRLGDNQPISLGARLERRGGIQVYAKCNSRKLGRISGQLDLRRALQNEDEIGQLAWYHPTRSSGSYAAGFDVALAPVGERVVAPPRGTNVPIVAGVKIVARSHTGQLVFGSSAALDHRNRARAQDETGASLNLRIDPKTGILRGTLRQPGSRTVTVQGIFQPGKISGGGVFGRTGEDGAIELSAEE